MLFFAPAFTLRLLTMSPSAAPSAPAHAPGPSGVDARLLELLAAKDSELEALREELTDVQRQLEYGVDWMLHTKVCAESGPQLPVPRVELSLDEEHEHARTWSFALVHKVRGGGLVRVPLGGCRSMGASFSERPWPAEVESEEGCREFGQRLPGLLNDMCLFCDQSGLTGIIVVGGMHVQITQLRPRLAYRQL